VAEWSLACLLTFLQPPPSATTTTNTCAPGPNSPHSVRPIVRLLIYWFLLSALSIMSAFLQSGICRASTDGNRDYLVLKLGAIATCHLCIPALDTSVKFLANSSKLLYLNLKPLLALSKEWYPRWPTPCPTFQYTRGRNP
jgi:hypothetical protein